MEEEDEAERWRRGDAPPSRGADSEACRADRARGKLAPCQDVLLSPSSITERSIQAHSGGAAGDCFEVVGDGSALAPTTLPPSLSLLALPPELLTLVAEQLDAHCAASGVRGLDARGLASFAAACSACLAAAHDELRAALHAAVTRCLVPDSGPQVVSRDALVACPYFSLPETLTEIPQRSFQDCTALASLSLPAGCTTIGKNAFFGCTQLTEVELPAALTTICNGAFDGSTSLERLSFPAALDKIGGWAFQGLTSLVEVDLSPCLGLTTIPYGAFAGNTALAKLTLPRALTTIATTAFYRCISLTELTLPASLVSVGDGAFNGCLALAQLNFREATALRSLGYGAFAGCESLTELILPDALSHVGTNAFYRCIGVTQLHLPASLITIGDCAFA